ncbi:MAG: radical SAM protein, partial [Deltaproteobacteria bacterium]|nr:radical SAM protein [Deltaproteobacteria bacterium]
NTVLELARRTKEASGAVVVVGGVHASNDPGFFNVYGDVDYVVAGLGKKSFQELIRALENDRDTTSIPGVAKIHREKPISFKKRKYGREDLLDHVAPDYGLVAGYRDSYVLPTLGVTVGFVSTAFGCPYSCSFCSVGNLTGHRYLTHSADAVVRDISLLPDVPVIRLVDANSFGNPKESLALCRAIQKSGMSKAFAADARADSVIANPELFSKWKDIGLRTVIVGFEEVSNTRLDQMQKKCTVEKNREAIRVFHDIGLTVVGDFIVGHDYTPDDFNILEDFILENSVDLPMLSVLTPLPGTDLYGRMKNDILITDLDYYTLTNAVIPTKMDEEEFYSRFSGMVSSFHANGKV